MDLFTDAKYWIRSGSFAFAKDRKVVPSQTTKTIRWNGATLHYRPGTSDIELLYRILLKPAHKREYQFPANADLKVIFDIGANIGASTVLLATQYPKAKIFAFEPVSDNVTVLRKNTQGFAQVTVLPYALGSQNQTKELFFSDDDRNFGGFSLYEAGSNPAKKVTIPIRHVAEVCQELKVQKIDLIKIDTEGAEHEILTAMEPALLNQTQWLLGELHGQKDFELLTLLSQHFEIEIHKPLTHRLSHFKAKNKN